MNVVDTAVPVDGRNRRVVVLLPTYNERENLEQMVEALGAVLPPEARVLVIDDSSPDGTGEQAEAMRARFAFLHVLRRPEKEGLGPAYIAGFEWALATDAELVLTMDCDFSHDPADVPRLLAAADATSIVIGSRYVAGGSVPEWTLARRLISRLGSLYARTILHLDVHDLTGGFKCYGRSVLEEIGASSIRSRGYMFQIETTYRARSAGYPAVELPITFHERRAGVSKMSGSIVAEALWRVIQLRAAKLAPTGRPARTDEVAPGFSARLRARRQGFVAEELLDP